jgi:imidazolonepropionase-like amidohydrolase
LKIDVDGFAHAPYYGWRGNTEDPIKDDLTVEDVKLAAKKKTIVIPTARLGKNAATDYAADGKPTFVEERFRRIIERQKRLFNLMRKSGVTLALGSDNYGRTLGEELWYFYDNQIFDTLTLLRIATEITPQTIFPNRKIGRLLEGYEASFLVINDNPLEDFNRLKNIERRFKQGEWIKIGRLTP